MSEEKKVHKEKIHHPSEAKNDEDHIRFAKHAIKQVELGHYGFRDISVTQNPGTGGLHHTASWVLFETDPSVPASDPTE